MFVIDRYYWRIEGETGNIGSWFSLGVGRYNKRIRDNVRESVTQADQGDVQSFTSEEFMGCRDEHTKSSSWNRPQHSTFSAHHRAW